MVANIQERGLESAQKDPKRSMSSMRVFLLPLSSQKNFGLKEEARKLAWNSSVRSQEERKTSKSSVYYIDECCTR